jgi:hypothetical protein
MATKTSGAGSGSVVSVLNPPSNDEYKEYLVKRDMDQPFSFAGQQLAHARHVALPISGIALEGAVFRTRGGKFITSLSKTSVLETMSGDQPAPDSIGGPSGYSKAAVHNTFEEAMRWFKPGRITDELRRQLGLDKPLRIE